MLQSTPQATPLRPPRPPGPLRAAVIGAGAFGRHHARIYGELASEDVRLVGLVDIDRNGPRELAERLGVPLVASLDALPEPVDLVSVVVPTTMHRAVAEPLLRRGVHCLVEKPIAGSTPDARALVEAAAAGGAHLQVGHVERFNPVMAAAERLGEAPLYIEVHRLAPFRARAADVGVVMDLMIHDLDIIHHLVGEEALEVQAVGVSVTGGLEDMANARLTFPSGCVANVTASRVSEQRMRRLRVFSSTGYLSLDYDSREARLVRPKRHEPMWHRHIQSQAARGPLLDESDTCGQPPAFEASLLTQRLPIDDGEPLRAEIEALVHTVLGRGRPHVGGGEGLRALGLAERILAEIGQADVASGV